MKKNGSFPDHKGQDLCVPPPKRQGPEVRGRRGSCTAPCKPDSPTGSAAPLRGRVKQNRTGQQGEDFLSLSHPDNPRGRTKAAGVLTGRVLPELHLLRVCRGGVGISGGSDSMGNPLTQGDHSRPLLGAAGKAGLAYPLPHSPWGPPTEPATRRAVCTLAPIPGETSSSLESYPGQRQGQSRYSWRVSGPMSVLQL